jgi:flagellar basal-body rod modification protein FlgD
MNPITAASTTTQTAAQTSSNNSLGGGMDSMFMQLLVTQLQNQYPLSPMDPSTFVNQLVGVNSLDQLTQINQLLQSTLGSSSTTNAGGH